MIDWYWLVEGLGNFVGGSKGEIPLYWGFKPHLYLFIVPCKSELTSWAAMKFKETILFYFLFQVKVHATVTEGTFNKLIIPKDNLHVYESMKLLGLSDCISLCLLHDNDKCGAVVHDQNGGTCSFGRFVVPAGTKRKIVSKDKAGPDDIVIYGRETAIRPKSGYVPVLLSVFSSDVTQTRLSSTPEVTGDVTSPLVGTKPVGDLAGAGIPSFVVPCGNGFVACGGVLTTNAVVKTCRYAIVCHHLHVQLVMR